MNADARGDIGFLEAMIAMMAVVTVLTAFLGVATHSATIVMDPTDGIDPDMMTGSISDGCFNPGFQGYLEDYADSRGLDGIAVTVLIPGGFCEEPAPVIVGSLDGSLFTRTVTSIVPMDDGRSVTAIFEVTVCA